MEAAQIYFNPDNQWLLNVVLASMVLGVALNIKVADFKHVLRMLKAVVVGLMAQFLLLPITTLLLTLILELPAGIELGMMLVAACPGGAISNFVTQLAGGNTALSISMTAIASTLAVVMLPFNFIFWSQFNIEASGLLTAISVDTSGIVVSLIFILALPLIVGLLVNYKLPEGARILHRFLSVTSTLALIAFVVVAVFRNKQIFSSNIEMLLMVVFIHNALAFTLGFFAGKASKLNGRDIKATTIEVGMQNSSLAIAIVFTQFDGEAGMALITAIWGTWHIVSGLLIALVFRYIGNPSEGRMPNPTKAARLSK
ncbi:hypothetical protein CHH28_07780 [Bacterioplanes sanyensis]|uniref:Bile acid:sodium symporter n=1 Tax=Bacterioplanes sanyensis TaxID=1249553 RepID=A0A222FIJ8_9GAMM|nr:bile acid:sodium symporter family protein [Bacterioplanes sanyensis]ASP38579.1 hypothetical protein CHH28_07780 [Bacterioplanes sanyensis]